MAFIQGTNGSETLFGDPSQIPQADTIIGFDGNDSLFGGFFDDFLFGGNGSDTLEGGEGNDQLFGGEGNDALRGGTGNDILDGGNGNAFLNGGTGNDILDGGEGNNFIVGGQGTDILNGGDGNDILNGQAGSDIMSGGEGNDIYAVSSPTDVVEEDFGTGTGTDSVQASVSYTLTDHVENLSLDGNSSINGTGNELNNTIIGNQGDNTLTGRAGNDILTGSFGNDRLNGDAGADRFRFFFPNEGADTITDFATVDFIEVSASGFGGGLTAGAAISAAQFRLGSSAGDASDRFIYNANNGALSFDVDGKGGAAQVLLATLSSTPTLAAADIVAF